MTHKPYKPYKLRTLAPHERNRLRLAWQQQPHLQLLQPPPEHWAWMSGAEAVAAGLVDPGNVRGWPGRRFTPPDGIVWVDISGPHDKQRKWAWGFAPWYLEDIARGLA